VGAASRNGLHVVPVTRCGHPGGGDQHARSGAVTVRQLGQVDHQRPVEVGQHPGQGVLQAGDGRHGRPTLRFENHRLWAAVVNSGSPAHCMTDILPATAIGVHTVTSGARLAYHLAATPDRARPRP
jgi:hypothetical protein